MILRCADGQALWLVVLARNRGSAIAGAQQAFSSIYHRSLGIRPVLQHAINRALCLVPSHRFITVIAAEHRAHLGEMLGGVPPGLLLEEPGDRGSAAAVLLALAHVLERDPDATVAVLPADHFVHPEGRFLGWLANAIDLACHARDSLVVLGAVPHESDADAERIIRGLVHGEDPWDGLDSNRPESEIAMLAADPSSAEESFRDGRLWNTGMVAAHATTLWRIGALHLPEMVRRFNILRQVLRFVLERSVPKKHATLALTHLYQEMGQADFTVDVLLRAQQSALALAMHGVVWSDWSDPGRAARIMTAINRAQRRWSRVASGETQDTSRRVRPGNDGDRTLTSQ